MTTQDAPTIAGDGDGMLAMEPPRSAEEAVTDALRQAIREGVLAPGQRLAQADLAEQLGVSRIPLRDALRRLEAEALVHIDGRRGARLPSYPKPTSRRSTRCASSSRAAA
jgi:DNA-binding GntR family transcriptional regulator